MKLHKFIKPFMLILLVLQSLHLAAQYQGGNDDGVASGTTIQSACGPVTYPNMYTGGTEDGFHAVVLVNSHCDSIILPAIFAGGIEQGQAMAGLSQATCNLIVYPNIFTGGNDNGFAMVGVTQVVCDAAIYPNMYSGGAEDGYSAFNLNQTNCSPAPLPNIYAGGIENGNGIIPLLTACAPFAEFSADQTTLCEGDTVQFSDESLGNPISWAWTFNGGNPATSTLQNPAVVYDTPGQYTVTLFITSGTGNSSITKTDYITVNAVPTPVITASGSTTFCAGDSVELACSPAYSAYLWSNGATTQNTFAETSGAYTVTVTAANGCPGISNPINVTVNYNPKPVVFSTGPSPLCVGDSAVLTSSLADSYQWSPGGQLTQSIHVTTSGTYWVSASYPDGCHNVSDPTIINFGNTPAKPVISASGPLTFCSGGSITLQSSPAPGYLWSPGNQTSQSITVSNSGTFYVEAVGTSGCTNVSDPIAVTVNTQTPVPTIAAGGPTTFCTGGSVVLTSSSASSYLWTPNGEVTQAITVSSSGTYTVQADNGTGCTAESLPITVTVNTQTPVPTIAAGGPTTFCAGGSVVLTSSASAGYLWNPGGQTTQSITVSASGTYSVQANNGTGCTAESLPITVTVNTQTPVPTIAAGGPTTFCAGGSVVLTSSASGGYLWNPGGLTTQSITVSSSGTYTVQANNGTGCTAESLPITVTVNTQTPVPTIAAGGPTTFCTGGSVVLTSSASSGYLWNPGGLTTQSITVSASGTYTVQADNGTGCTAESLPITVTVNTQTPVPTIAAGGPTTFCTGGSVVLTSSSASSYLWTPNGEVTQAITVSSAGTYTVQANNGTGCTAESLPITVTVNTQTPVPTIAAGGPTTFCAGGSVVLTSSSAASYLWTPGGLTTQSITVSSSGTYTVQANNGTGCTAESLPITVTVNTQTPVPTIAAGGPTTFCTGGSVVLTSSASGGYLWNPGGLTTQSITVSASGTYTVQANNGTGCTAESLPITVTVNTQTPVPTIAAGGPTTFCAGDSVVLTSSASGGYLWTPGGQTTQSITVSVNGVYSVQNNNGTGCTAQSAPVTVTVNSSSVTPVIQATGSLTFCEGDSVLLTTDPAISYHWYPTGETTQSITITEAGTHYVEVSNGTCPSVSIPVTIDVLNAPAIPTITVTGSMQICEGDSVKLTASPAATYLWSPGSEVTQSIWVQESGTYWAETFNASGCSATSGGTAITVNPNPVADISGVLIGCAGTSEGYTVSNVPGATYFWTVSGAQITGGSGTNSIEVTLFDEASVQIQVLVVDTSTGCSVTDLMNVSSLPAPTAFAGPDITVCYGDTVQIEAYGGTTYHWLPETGLSNPDIADPLAFTLVTTQYFVEAANGSCTDRDTMLLTVNPLPVADAGADLFITAGECDTLSGSGSQNYHWTPSTGLSNPAVSYPQACPEETTTYMLTVTDAQGCSAKDEVTVFVTQLSEVISFPNTFTPNGDGINDAWIIDGLEAYPDHKLIVFNRWGNQVFDAMPYLNDWVGDCIGKALPDGTYYFVLDLGDGLDIIKSYVTIIR